MNADLAAAMQDMRRDRHRLLAAVRPLTAAEMLLDSRGGWSIARVLEHVIWSESAYAKMLAHQCGKSTRDLDVSRPDDGATAAAQLAATRAAVEAAVDGVQDHTLYLLVQFGHEEFSALSLLQNIALHDREHVEQIVTLIGAALPGPSAAPGDETSLVPVVVRPATEADLARLTEIYNHYVVNTPATFDLAPLTLDERREWLSHYSTAGRHRLLVAERGAAVVGYASSSPFHPRHAYDTTVEMTVLSAPESVGQRVGLQLYQAIFETLAGEDIHSAVALITLPNDASCMLHERFGFTRAGLLRDAGRKFGRYWDVAFYQRVFEAPA